MMHANIMSFRCGPTLFIAAPDLHAVCTAARDWAARCNRVQIEAADLLLALYYDAHNSVSELLHMAVKTPQLDGAALQFWHSDLCGIGAEGGFGASGRAVLAQTAELGVHYRAPVDENVALLTSADLAVALLNDEPVKSALRAAGVAEVYLRHLEAALRLEERQPICFDAAALSAPSMVLH